MPNLKIGQDIDGNTSAPRWAGFFLIGFGMIIAVLGAFGIGTALTVTIFTTSILTGAGLITGAKVTERLTTR